MPVPLRRFRITRATAFLRTAHRAGRGTSLLLWAVHATLVGGVSHATAAPTESAAARALAAGDAAAERGWFAAARDHWGEAVRVATSSGDAATLHAAAARSTRLEAIAQDAARTAAARRLEHAALPTASPWRSAWRTSASAADCGRAAESPPVSIVGGLALWNTGRAVHAVGLAEGRPAWGSADGRDTLIFPRGSGGRLLAPMPPCAAEAAAIACAAGRAYAVIDQGRDGQLLSCLDLSAAAEGRLAWFRAASSLVPGPQAAAAAFDGPPVVDHEVCAVVLRTGDGRGSLALAVLDPRDGSPRWIRSLGSASIDGVDRARGRRQACLAEDRIIVAAHAGMVHAFDRDGAVAWTAPTPAPDSGGRGDACIAPASVVDGRLLIAASDGTHVAAFEPRHGDLLWRWRAIPERVTLVLGGWAGGAVIATHGPDDSSGTTLRRLSIEDGRPAATFAGPPQAVRAFGHGTIADGTIFWPVCSAAGAVAIELVDAVTLERRGEPIECGRCSGEPDSPSRPPRLAVADGSLVIADDALTCWRPASSSDGGAAADASQR